jgi:CheY-like chemotaxis protein
MHTLVIDDDPLRLRWFQDTLERAGHEVRLADHAEAALDQFREVRFDLAFFDHDLGPPRSLRNPVEMNGSRLLGAVLNAKRYMTPLAVWVHSANPIGAENIASKCRSAGIRYCIGSYINLTKDPEGFLTAVATFGEK